MLARVRFIGLILLVLLAASACTTPESPAGDGELTHVDLYLSFQPDVQFAPFYVAVEQGYFLEHGLEVTITHQSESDAVRLVGVEQPDSGIRAAVVSGEQVLLARSQDIPVVYVFEWYQKFPIAIASKQEMNIITVNDLAGHTVGVPMLEGASYTGLRALLSAGGLSESDITVQATGFTQVETLSTDRVDAVVIYSTNEPVQLEAAGVAVNLINVSDVVDIVSNGLVVSEDAIAENPDAVRALVAALSEALQYTIDNPAEAFTASQQHVEGLDDPDIEATQRAVLDRSIALWTADRLGQSDVASWLATQDTLRNMGVLTDEVDVNQAFTNDFLP